MEEFRVDTHVFNMDKRAECFFVIVSGDGMVNAGIKDKDTLLFRATNTPKSGSIVAVEVDGKLMCRRYIRKGKTIILRREELVPIDTPVKNCTFKGELQSLIRNYA